MKRFLHIGLSTLPNTHSKEMRTYFEGNGWVCEDIPVQHRDLNNEIIRYANEFKPNLVFIQIQDYGISEQAIKALKGNGAFILNWCGDIRNHLPTCYLQYSLWGVDLTCFSNMRDIEHMRSLGHTADWLQIGYSQAIYNTTGPVDHRGDIIFMGNNIGSFPLSGLRRDMVRELKHTYGDLFRAYGNGQPDGNFMGNQHGEAAVYRGAKIGINLSHFDSPRYTSDRMFRMLGCGICVLSHAFTDVYNDFLTGTEIAIWHDIDDLKGEIRRLLNPETTTAKSIAARGNQMAEKRHTFYHMGKNIEVLYKKYTDGIY